MRALPSFIWSSFEYCMHITFSPDTDFSFKVYKITQFLTSERLWFQIFFFFVGSQICKFFKIASVKTFSNYANFPESPGVLELDSHWFRGSESP